MRVGHKVSAYPPPFSSHFILKLFTITVKLQGKNLIYGIKIVFFFLNPVFKNLFSLLSYRYMTKEDSTINSWIVINYYCLLHPLSLKILGRAIEY